MREAGKSFVLHGQPMQDKSTKSTRQEASSADAVHFEVGTSKDIGMEIRVRCCELRGITGEWQSTKSH